MKIYLRTAHKDEALINTLKTLLIKDKNKVDIAPIEIKDKDDYSSNQTGNIIKYDLFVVEASIPNAQLGYEVAFAIEKNIPTVVLYNDETDNKSFFPLMAVNPKAKLIIKGYKATSLKEDINSILDEVSDYIDNKFILNLTPQISDFLNWISENKKVTRADYVRSLIESALKKSTEYKLFLRKKS